MCACNTVSHLNTMLGEFESCLASLKSEYKRLKYLTAAGKYVHPEKYLISYRMQLNNNAVLEQQPFYGLYISISNVFNTELYLSFHQPFNISLPVCQTKKEKSDIEQQKHFHQRKAEQGIEVKRTAKKLAKES